MCLYNRPPIKHCNCEDDGNLLVGAVPPAYYAHLAAFRARFYMEPDAQEGKGARVPRETGVRPLPALKENVKRVMFYC